MTAEITSTESPAPSGDIKVTGTNAEGRIASCYANKLSKDAIAGAYDFVRKALAPRWTAPDDLRFRTTEYVVDATHEESFNIWHRWSHLYGAPFEQDSMGHCSEIGRIADRPIVVNVFWYIIADLFRVAFVSGCSQLVDHKMIEDWQKAVFPCLSGPGYRHSDAGNFGNLLGDMGRRMGDKSLVRRNPMLVDKALRMIDEGKIK